MPSYLGSRQDWKGEGRSGPTSRKKKRILTKSKDRIFYENQTTLLKSPYRTKMGLYRREAKLFKQINKSVVVIVDVRKEDTALTLYLSRVITSYHQAPGKQIRFKETIEEWKSGLRPSPECTWKKYLNNGRAGV
jgi:hypothetical protein